MNIDAGALNKRVTLQKSNMGTDAYGDDKGAVWVDVATVWANVTNISAREFWEARAAHGELTHKITIRYREGVTADMRVIYGGVVLDVIAPPVDYDERHQYLVLKCRVVTT